MIKIVHVGNIRATSFSGVSVVVPQHIEYQSYFAKTYLLNLKSNYINGVENQTYISSVNDFTNAINQIEPDIVIFHEVYYKIYLSFYKFLIKKKVPYIVVPHGCLTKQSQKNKYAKKLFANLLFFNKFLIKASAIQCLSEPELKDLRINQKTFIGTNGTNTNHIKKASFAVRKEFIFTYIGRLDPYHKGIDLLVDAVSLNKSFFIDNNCIFNLYGPEVEEWTLQIKKMIKAHSLEGLVNLYGPVQGDNKENILLDSDAFIQTSRFEGMPLGIIEALSYGIPCLVTEGTNLKELVLKYKAGVGVDNSVENISTGMIKLVECRKFLEEMSGNALTLINENFEWRTIARTTIDKYMQFIDRR